MPTLVSEALKGRVALVTGASKGIGKAIALALGLNSATVVAHYNSSEDGALDVVQQINDAGGKAMTFRANVAESREVKALFEAALESFGRLDIVVAAAGVPMMKPIGNLKDEDFDLAMKVNVYGAFYTIKEAAMRLGDGGRIIALSSSTTTAMLPTYSVYAATKGAVEQLCRHLAKELGPRNITVNVISPGPTDTDLFRVGKSEEQIRRLESMAALGRLGRPDDIADVVTFLAGNGSRWITGANIKVNGGFN